jgi:segregation and condensation protein B
MKRGKKKEAAAAAAEATSVAEDLTPTVAVDAATDMMADMTSEPAWDGPTRAARAGELAGLVAESGRLEVTMDLLPPDGEGDAREVSPAEGELGAEGAVEGDLPEPVVESAGRLEGIIESLLYAAERALTVSDLKRLVNERDAKKVMAALEALRERHADTGIQLASLAGGWQFRTHPDNGSWVAKLVAGRPQRLSRAMLEALAIVAYRQPITRPEIDEIRGVDCGPVLKTLLDRGFVRIIGKKEDVGRPLLYGTTPDFLRTFSLGDLSELPTLREFHELSEQQMASVDAKAPLGEGAQGEAAVPTPTEARSPFAPTPLDLSPVDLEEEEDLLTQLDSATLAATQAAGPSPGAPADAAAAARAPVADSPEA